MPQTNHQAAVKIASRLNARLKAGRLSREHVINQLIGCWSMIAQTEGSGSPTAVFLDGAIDALMPLVEIRGQAL